MAATTTTRYLMLAIAAAAVVLAVVSPAAAAAETQGADQDDCQVAQQSFSWCLSYVAGMEDSVPPQCCTALSDVNDLGGSAPQRRAICQCILSEMVTAGKGTVVSSRAAGLPGACNVQIGFIPTSPGFDCSALL